MTSVLSLLRDVSRSFYLTLRVLPSAIRPQIGLAYLLARATDTIADTGVLPVTERLETLDRLRARILRASAVPLDLARFTGAGGGATEAERLLLARIEDALAMLGRLEAGDQELVREVLGIITSGQELDLRRFGGASAAHIVALQNEADLEDYTYRVAGCVGEFWTKMCQAHLFRHTAVDASFLLAQGARFGKGLQLVNVLRDLPEDLRQGRCYLPGDQLAVCGLHPAALLDSRNMERLRPCYGRYLSLADGYLADGWSYTNALPRSQVRVRLACAWPLLIGARTLACLRQGNVLDPDHRIKVSRAEVRRLLLSSLVRYPCARAWDGLFARARA